MSWPPYKRQYKASGLPWIGDIPDHWDIAPTRSLLQLRREIVGVRSADFPLLSLTLRGVILRDLSENKGKFPAEFDSYQAVEPDDIVLCLFDIEETPRTVGVAHERGMITGAYDVFRPRDGVDVQYMEYLYLSLDQRKSLSYFYSGLRKVIRMPTFKSIRWPVPPLVEQRAIAIFLDRETTKIDALIAKQEQLIATLREDRAATITHAVTKGLDPDVEMKRLDPELAEMPVRWSVRKLKHAGTLVTGSTPPTSEQSHYSDDPDGLPWFRPDDLDAGGSPSVATRYLSDTGCATVPCLPPSSVHVVSIGATLAKVGYVTVESSSNQQITAVVGCENAKFLFYAVTASRDRIWAASMGNTLPIISAGRLGVLKLGFPPAAEQAAIVSRLDEVCRKVDALVAKSELMIETLQEYRSALITDAVTGKIDVRGAA